MRPCGNRNSAKYCVLEYAYNAVSVKYRHPDLYFTLTLYVVQMGYKTFLSWTKVAIFAPDYAEFTCDILDRTTRVVYNISRYVYYTYNAEGNLARRVGMSSNLVFNVLFFKVEYANLTIFNKKSLAGHRTVPLSYQCI